MIIAPAEDGSAPAVESTKAAGSSGTKPTKRTGRSRKGRNTGRGLSDKKTAKLKSDPAKTGRTGSKQEKLIAMLRRADGATVEEMVKAFGWQPHTVRGAIAGALKKKLELNVISDKIDGRGRVYRIVD